MCKSIPLLTLLFVGLILATGCADRPDEALEVVESAFEDARAAQAADYAPESMQQAEDLRVRLEAELKAQEERFGMFRSFKTASRLAEEAKDAAVQASAEAASGRERVKLESADLIAEARQVLTEARSSLASAPGGKGGQADLALMKADLDEVEITLTEADADFAAERFMEARLKAEAVRNTAETVRSDIETAIRTIAQARRGR